MTDRTYSPSLAQRILASERQNGDLVTDLTKLACQLAVDRRRPVSEDEARLVASDLGLEFDDDGWVDEPWKWRNRPRRRSLRWHSSWRAPRR